MSQLFESLMVISFGISWPLSIIKSYRSKTAKGKSLLFSCFILMGYGFGITSKLLQANVNYVLIFYVINFVMVATDIALYFRNLKYDRQNILHVQEAA